MQNILKNKLLAFMISFVFVFIGSSILNTSRVYAKLNDSLFWGVTPNFTANSFEGFVIQDNNGSYDEKYHSLLYDTGNVPFSSLRIDSTGKSASGMSSITSLGFYKTLAAIPDNNSIKYTSGVEFAYGIFAKSPNNTLNESATNFFKTTSAFISTEEYDNLIAQDWNPTSIGIYGTAIDYRKRNAIYTWPGPNGAGDVTEAESQYLSKLSTTLLNGYNDAISLILNNNSSDLGIVNSSASQKAAFLDLSIQIANAASTNSTSKEKIYSYKVSGLGTDKASYGIDVQYSVRGLTQTEMNEYGYDEINGLGAGDVVKITAYKKKNNKFEKGDSIIAIAKYPKGYGAGQDLVNLVINRSGEKVLEDEENRTNKINWGHIAYQAVFNFYNNAQDSTSAADFYKSSDGFLTTMVTGLVNAVVAGLTGLLGLYSIEELCLNTGARGIAYWNGLFPGGWFTSAQYFYLFTFTLSMLMLLISLVRLAGIKAASTVGNVAKKISLMEGVKKIIISAAAVMLFVPIFTILSQMNNLIVETLITLIPEGQSINFTIGSTSGMGLAGALIGVMMFWVTLKMNFTYILRGVTVLFCYILAPVAIMANAVGDKYSQITSNWLKELIGNMFIQSVHALIMMVYITIASTGSVVSIEKLVLVYSFIPLTEFVRTNLFGLGKGLDSVAEGLTSGISQTAAGMGEMLTRSKGHNKANAQGGAGISPNGKSKAGNSYSSENGLTPGKVGVIGKIKGIKEKGFAGNTKSALRTAGGGITGAVKGVARSLPGVATGIAKSSLMLGTALGEGASNSQGRMSPFSTRSAGMAMGETLGDAGGHMKDSILDDIATQQAKDGAINKSSFNSTLEDAGIDSIEEGDNGENYITYSDKVMKNFQKRDVNPGFKVDGGQFVERNGNLVLKTDPKTIEPCNIRGAGKDKITVSNPGIVSRFHSQKIQNVATARHQEKQKKAETTKNTLEASRITLEQKQAWQKKNEQKAVSK